MKKILSLISISLLLLFAINACNNEEEVPFTPMLTLSADYLPFDAVESITPETVQVTSNTMWTAVSDKAWCIVSPASGENDGTISVRVTANPELTERTAVITVTAKDVPAQTINVTQVGTAPMLQLAKTDYEVKSDTSVLAIDVTTNLAEINYAISADWIHFKEIVQKSAVVKTFTFAIDKNETVAARPATITFSAEGVSDVKANIVQDPMDVGFEIISPADGTMLLPSDVTDTVFVVSSASEFEVSAPTSSWMTFVSKTKEGNRYVLKYTFIPNTTDQARMDSVVFTRSADQLKIGVINVTQWVAGGNFQSDSLALMAIYKATNGAKWKDPYKWDITKPMRTYNAGTGKYIWNTTAYPGISYDGVNTNRVTAVNLGQRMAGGGYIPNEVGMLTEITNLSMHADSLTGTIPEEIGNLKKLTILSLHDNSLTGTIPEKLGDLPLVANFVLQNNKLTGEIPKSIGKLIGARQINLSNNQLSGPIPAELFTLQKISLLDLRMNKLTSIPANIGDCKPLGAVHFEGNRLTGNIPTSICDLSNLKDLYLGDNDLTGGIPENIGNLSLLMQFDIRNNPNLGGTIPASICNLRSLVYLVASNCGLTGTLPADIGNLTRIQKLCLQRNSSLGGTLPASLLNLSNTLTASVQLDSCSFTGTLDNLAGMRCDGQFSLSHNNFTGTIPQGWVSNSNFSPAILWVDQNQLDGSIPDFGPSKFKRLTNFRAGYNKLSGAVPDSLIQKHAKDPAAVSFCPQEGAGFTNYQCE